MKVVLFLRRVIFACVDYCKNDGTGHLRCEKCARMKPGACWYVDCPRHPVEAIY